MLIKKVYLPKFTSYNLQLSLSLFAKVNKKLTDQFTCTFSQQTTSKVLILTHYTKVFFPRKYR